MRGLIAFIKYLFARKSRDMPWSTVIICRFKGHPDGVVWVNPSGLEPDMTCKKCGDDLS